MSIAFLPELRTSHESTRFRKLLEEKVTAGTLHLGLPGGARYRFGRGEPEVEWIFHDTSALGRILRDPELEMGETYVEGAWDAGHSGLSLLLQVLIRNLRTLRQVTGYSRVTRLLQRQHYWSNDLRRSYRNVSRHYDLDEWLFRSFLDDDLNYSCAYFPRSGMSLEEAQEAKLALIRRKLRPRAGQRVLDIGSGWGSLALYLAERDDVEVTGLTLSHEQLRVARERANERGLAHRVCFVLQDYREHRERYDRIVSVGMFEHVGKNGYPPFFRMMRRSLRPDGLALLHTIGRSSSPCPINEWIERRIFPGSHLPSLSELSRNVEQSGLVTTDVEVLRLHYARTIACWIERFQSRRPEIAARLGENFCRTWEFYLASSEASFTCDDLVVFQLQLGHTNTAAPLTRDYLWREEGHDAVPFSQGARATKSSEPPRPLRPGAPAEPRL